MLFFLGNLSLLMGFTVYVWTVFFISLAVYNMGLPNWKTLLETLEIISHYLALLDPLPNSLYFSYEIHIRLILILLGLQLSFCFIYYHFISLLPYQEISSILSQFNFFVYVSLVLDLLSSFPFSSLISLRIQGY